MNTKFSLLWNDPTKTYLPLTKLVPRKPPIFRRSISTYFAITLGLSGFAVSHVYGSDAPIEIALGQRQLFLDDYVIERMDDLQRTMHRPEKRGAVIRPDIASDGNRLETMGSAPMWVPDEGVYKMVYMAYPVSEMNDNSEIGPALAISRDGISWTKPLLDQGVSIQGSKENNRLRLADRRSWTNEIGLGNGLFNVIYDPDDPNPSQRYKALIGIQGRTPAVSSDCIHWNELPSPLIPSSDTSTLSYDRANKRYLAFLKGKNKFGRAVMLSTSKDFLHWEVPEPCFGADLEDQRLAIETIRQRLLDRHLDRPLFVDPDPALGFNPPNNYIPTWRAECYDFSSFAYEGVYIGLPTMYYPTGQSLPGRANTDGFDIIQLAVSRDLKTWKRVGDRKAFIGPSTNEHGLVGVFDRMQLSAPGCPITVGDELWFYYSGFKTRIPMYSLNPDGTKRDAQTLTKEERNDLEDGWAAICLAVLRRDGFVSLDAKQSAGVLLTHPLKITGETLWVNMNAVQGSAKIELMTESGEPIPGFSGEHMALVKGDGVRLPVVFASGQKLDALGSSTVRLRVELSQASLYAFWTE